MKVGNISYRTIWLAADGRKVEIIDQTRLPHEFEIVTLSDLNDAVYAIKEMQVRGAPLIGATAAYGFCLSLAGGSDDSQLVNIGNVLKKCRPTAVNLRWAVDRMYHYLVKIPTEQRLDAAYAEAARICEEDVLANENLGRHGMELIQAIWEEKGRKSPVNILTHCNAGWLATVDWGTALAPVFKATEAGIPVHVWVDETRPRNQGASLTAWELSSYGIAHHLICDNSGGHLMQHGQVDMCIVGTDRTTASGDVCNKIGTYLKALAAKDNDIPFYVALPGATIDWTMDDGLKDIPIEERIADEVTWIQGKTATGSIERVCIVTEDTPAANPAFDVTPSRLVTGLITERGVCAASREGLTRLYPEQGQL